MLSEESESLGYKSDQSFFLFFRIFSFVSRFFILDLLYFLSFDESDSLDDEADDDISESGSTGTSDFLFCFE